MKLPHIDEHQPNTLASYHPSQSCCSHFSVSHSVRFGLSTALTSIVFSPKNLSHVEKSSSNRMILITAHSRLHPLSSTYVGEGITISVQNQLDEAVTRSGNEGSIQSDHQHALHIHIAGGWLRLCFVDMLAFSSVVKVSSFLEARICESEDPWGFLVWTRSCLP